MTHQEIELDLAEYAWGELEAERSEQVERHLAGCAGCWDEVAAIREIRDAAAELPGAIAPRRELWTEIAARLEPRGRRVIPFPLRIPRTLDLPRSGLAAAAVLLIAASSALTALLLRPDAAGSPPVASAPAPVLPPVTSALVAFRPAEAEYERAAAELETLLEAQRNALSPQTVAIVEANLRMIDRAIAEARAALEADPNNRQLTQMLSAVHETRVELLRQVVQL